MIILGIETSCDESAVAIVKDGREVLSSVLYSQVQEHLAFQGVVPEIASRSHLKELLPICRQALQQAHMDFDQIDAIAVTSKPGLMGALMVGVVFAKSLAYALKKPLIDVHHIYGHLVSISLQEKPIQFPLIALIASGGHTTLVQMNSFFEFTILAKSIDDAAGEALDKAAKLLDLGFPGGPAIEAFANGGNSNAFDFPMPLKGELNFSFSGLKTSLLHKIQKHPNMNAQEKKDMTASFQETIMNSLCEKLALAQEKTGIDNLAICGGVAKNQVLRDKIGSLVQGGELYMTPMAYCTDNAAMIAAAAFYTQQKDGFAGLDLIPKASAPML